MLRPRDVGPTVEGIEMNQVQGEPKGPLAGVRVIEFSQVVAGPSCGRVLAELGADVIKVEPPDGDPYRNTGTVVPNEGKRFQSLNLGKRSLVVDLSKPEGQAVVQRLAKTADVLLVNYRHGVADRIGIGYDTISKINPALIYCRITGFGVHSAAATLPATDPMMQAYSGLMVGGGKVDEDGLPESVSATAIADYTTGFGSAIAICAALYARRDTGRGQLINTSLLRSALSVQDTNVMREPVYDATQRDPLVAALEELRDRGGTYREMIDTRQGMRSRTMSLRFYSGAYQAKDGVIMLGALTPNSRASARRVLGIKDDPTEHPPEDASAPEYVASLQGLHDQIAATIRSNTVRYWVDALQDGGCPAAPVNFPEMMSDDPIVEAEGLMVEVVNATTGPQKVIGPMFEMSDTPTAIHRASPPLGGHTHDVLVDSGFSEAEIAELLAAGTVHTRF